jgi:hypothetical protein
VQTSIVEGEDDLLMTTLYTIGYEGTDIDRFVATLKAVNRRSNLTPALPHP